MREDWEGTFLEELRGMAERNGRGKIGLAAELAGTTAGNVRYHAARDPRFKEAVTRARNGLPAQGKGRRGRLGRRAMVIKMKLARLRCRAVRRGRAGGISNKAPVNEGGQR